jgi:hypothetical protein
VCIIVVHLGVFCRIASQLQHLGLLVFLSFG